MSRDINELVGRYKRKIEVMSTSLNRRTGIPTEDFISKLYETLWLSSKDFDEGKGLGFDAWLNHRLRKASIDVMRSREGTYRKRVLACLDGNREGSEEDTAMSETLVDERIDDEVFLKKRKRLDQLRLIESLLQSCQTDPVTTAIVTIFETHDGNLRAIGKSLGIHHQTVKRKLTALSRHYDGNRFGDIRDYLAV